MVCKNGKEKISPVLAVTNSLTAEEGEFVAAAWD
jgi:hypothetical protein